MIRTAPTPVWRPYAEGDEPLFTPGLLYGFAALSDVERRRLVTYLTALTERRRVVHAAVAFNAVYFGYDIDYGGYVGGPVDFDQFPTVTSGEVGGALPVGAMVQVPTGAGPLYAEIIYKEGAHPAVGEDGELPDWLSGAPAGARGPSTAPDVTMRPLLRERLVPDFNAFGEELTATEARIERIRRQGRLLNAAGHILHESSYPSAAAAEASDLDFYAEYLLTAGREQLLAGPLPLLLSADAGEEQLAAALGQALGTITDALASASALRCWRSYAFTRDDLGSRLCSDGPLGGGDLETVVSRLGRGSAPVRSRRFAAPGAHVRYTAVGPLLRGVRDAEPLLRGVGYAIAVCHVNTVIGDYAVRDAEDGALPGGAHLRIDDAWQAGGVWRTSSPPGPLAHIDPLLPCGQGWLDTLPSTRDAEPEVEPGSGQQPEADDKLGDGGGGELLSVTDSHLAWRLPLRLTYLQSGVCPVPAAVRGVFAGHGLAYATLRLALTHDGYDLDPGEATQPVALTPVRQGVGLTGVEWPLEFFPGVVLTFTWQRGARVLRAATTLLDTPVTVDEVTYEHRFDPQVLTRDTAPGCVRRGQTAQGPLSLRERVLRAVRRAGLLDPDGVAVLRRDLLAEVVYSAQAGPGADAALGPVVAGLLGEGVLRIEWVPLVDGRLHWPVPNHVPAGTRLIESLLWHPAPRPASAGSGSEPAGGQPTPARVVQYVLTYEVAAFLRKLPPGCVASEDKHVEYRALTARYGRPRDLPRGYTLVTGHTRHR